MEAAARGIATMAAGAHHSLVVRDDGEIMGFGQEFFGRLRVPTLPQGRRYVGVAAGADHSVALRDDGKVLGFGINSHGQCHAPELPPLKRYIGVAAGGAHSLALRDDGVLVAFGLRNEGQSTVPELPDGVCYIGLAARSWHSLALRDDGVLVAFGRNRDGQCDVPPLESGRRYTGLAAGGAHSLALRDDGLIVAFGRNFNGQCEVPELPEGMRYTAVAAGAEHSVALRSDGQVLAFGADAWGQCCVPVLQPGQTYVQIAAGDSHSLTLRSDGEVQAFGCSAQQQCRVPSLPLGCSYRVASRAAPCAKACPSTKPQNDQIASDVEQLLMMARECSMDKDAIAKAVAAFTKGQPIAKVTDEQQPPPVAEKRGAQAKAPFAAPQPASPSLGTAAEAAPQACPEQAPAATEVVVEEQSALPQLAHASDERRTPTVPAMPQEQLAHPRLAQASEQCKTPPTLATSEEKAAADCLPASQRQPLVAERRQLALTPTLEGSARFSAARQVAGAGAEPGLLAFGTTANSQAGLGGAAVISSATGYGPSSEASPIAAWHATRVLGGSTGLGGYTNSIGLGVTAGLGGYTNSIGIGVTAGASAAATVASAISQPTQLDPQLFCVATNEAEVFCVGTDPASVMLPTISPERDIEEDIRVILPEELNMSTRRSIGKGSFGEVFRARWRGRDIAVKEVHADKDATLDAISAFMSEVEMLKRCRHRYVVQVLGFSLTPMLMIVMELCSCSLSDRLHRHQCPPGLLEKLWLLGDAALGIAYLHLQKVVHRDLKPANILLVEEGYDDNCEKIYTAKVADFSLARVSANQTTTKGPACGTPHYMAPEALSIKPRFSTASDVFAFGVIMWETSALRVPYQAQPDLHVVITSVRSGEREDIHAAEPELKELIEACWSQEPARRPSFRKILRSMPSGPSFA